VRAGRMVTSLALKARWHVFSLRARHAPVQAAQPAGCRELRQLRPPQAVLAAAAHLKACPRPARCCKHSPRPVPLTGRLRRISTNLLALAGSGPCIKRGPRLRPLPARATPGPKVVDAPKEQSRQQHPPVQPAQLSRTPPLLTRQRCGVMQAPTPSSQTSYNTLRPALRTSTAAFALCCGLGPV
jgi:hypothetical protein